MFRDLRELQYYIEDNEFNSLKEIIIASARPSIEIVLSPKADEEIPLGQSKLGGSPDLPANFEWRKHNEIPLTFIGQFNLAELAQAKPLSPTPERITKQLTLWDMDTISTIEPRYAPQKLSKADTLPKNGILYFFYDELMPSYNEIGGWHIEYRENTENLVRTKAPNFAIEGRRLRTLPSHKIQFVEKLLIPSGLYIDGNDFKFFTDALFTDYLETYWKQGKRPWHHFYGYPRNIQSEIEWECVLMSEKITVEYNNRQVIYFDASGKIIEQTRLNDKKSEWLFLFQISSDDSLKVMWGDVGILSVCIPKKSLSEMRFEDCCVVMQSH